MKRTAQGIETTKNSVEETSAEPKSGKRKMHPNSLKNLVAPWKPGDVPNPTGKNQHDESAEICRAVIGNNKEQIYLALVRGLLKGNFYGFDVVATRGFGKLKERIEHSASEDLIARLLAGRKRANAK